ncbi:hypothetical protein DSO57_1017510 [Entomophthora muscae]|uniref:Uncharacterized protein n=1 Tax=Entomophthora muscae TaxID=34485 RepID=A0ACC2SHX7_9FUNG|nr:hypothetical protein DSO57_1017510 [Entomophthora muscae]
MGGESATCTHLTQASNPEYRQAPVGDSLVSLTGWPAAARPAMLGWTQIHQHGPSSQMQLGSQPALVDAATLLLSYGGKHLALQAFREGGRAPISTPQGEKPKAKVAICWLRNLMAWALRE